MNRISPTVKQLLIINVIFYFGSSMSLNTEFIYSLFSLHFPENPDFKFWQLISHMFMHGGILHLAFNMFALWMFGSAIESIFGSRRFLFFYITCGLGAAIAQISLLYYNFHTELDLITNSGFLNSNEVLNDLYQGEYAFYNGQPLLINTSFFATMVGASGAIMGVLVAFGMFFPESKLMLIFFPVPIKAKYFIPAIILLDLFSAITGQAIFSPSNTAFVAHLGGALTGFLIMYYWKRNQFNQNRWY
tara:strand:+ start:353 stop:1090 length:738 start_codon:yes stop_codon:yes gene_type:complete